MPLKKGPSAVASILFHCGPVYVWQAISNTRRDLQTTQLTSLGLSMQRYRSKLFLKETDAIKCEPSAQEAVTSIPNHLSPAL